MYAVSPCGKVRRIRIRYRNGVGYEASVRIGLVSRLSDYSYTPGRALSYLTKRLWKAGWSVFDD